MEFHYPPSLHLANTPTPIQKLERLSAAWGGPEIFIKRDDLTGCVLSGNKIRKLEFSVAEALERGADTLITCGGIQSNHARATAFVAAMRGMKCLLLLRGSADAAPEGNVLLDRLAGADIRFITPEAYQEVDAVMAGVARELEGKGRKPYIIPEGASNEIGYFGYIRASEELGGQLQQLNVDMDFVVTAVGSGGTLGGLELGRKIFGTRPKPVGINVCDTAEHFRKRIGKVLQNMILQNHWPFEIGGEDLSIIDGYVGEGYALSRREELELIAEAARLEGIVMDPVYTGKALFGLRDQIQKGRFTRSHKVLFVHTGGVFGLFAQGKAFEGI
jgi:D-cysteine desulfhydrase